MTSASTPDFKLLFQSAPGLYLVLLPDFTIIAASDAYLQATMMVTDAITGRSIFEIFPDNKVKLSSDLRVSLNYVCQNKKPHTMAIHQYNIHGQDDIFEEKYTTWLNTPVFNGNHEIAYIIHTIENTTRNGKEDAGAINGNHLFKKNTKKEKKGTDTFKLNAELIFQNEEKEKRAAELVVANEELIFQNQDKEKRAAELIIANTQLFFESEEKEKRAAELVIANEELIFQNQEKENRAAELIIANKELSFQKEEKEKRAAELIIANREHAFESYEKEKMATDLKLVNAELEYRVKQRTEELDKSEKHFRALIENNNDLINVVDQSGKIIYRSPAAYRITGWTNEEILNAAGFVNVHPDDREKANEVMRKTLANPGKPIYSLLRNRHKNGEYIWLEGVVTNLLHNENVKGFVANYHDVTDRVKAEEQIISSEKRFRSLIENSAEGIALMDEFSNIFYRSLASQKITGIRRTENTLNFTHPEDINMIKQKFSEALLKPGVPISFQGRFLHAAGYYFWMEGTLTNLLAVKGIDAIVSNFRDITQRKKTEEKIKNLNIELEEKVIIRTEQLKKSNEELEAFSYSVSHDLRAPLRAIMGYTTILEEDYGSKLDDEAKRITTVIKHSTVKMGKLIDDLLAFSRMGRHDLVKTTIDTNELIGEIKMSMEQMENTSKNIKWVIHTLPDMQGDINTIRQVWINLMSNAVKYSGKQIMPVIEIGSFIKKRETVFFIKDNGVGFDEKYKQKLFKVFQRLHSGDEFEGTGIGLAIIDKIISRHGGKVWAKGELNKGAAFYFTLPADKQMPDKNYW